MWTVSNISQGTYLLVLVQTQWQSTANLCKASKTWGHISTAKGRVQTKNMGNFYMALVKSTLIVLVKPGSQLLWTSNFFMFFITNWHNTIQTATSRNIPTVTYGSTLTVQSLNITEYLQKQTEDYYNGHTIE
jgi:hypothetical protein